MLKDHIQIYGEMKMVFASSVSYEQLGFLEIVVIPKQNKEKRRFSIPVQYVVAIADLPESLEEQKRMGFQ